MADPGVGIAIAVIGLIIRLVLRTALRDRDEDQLAKAEVDNAARLLRSLPDFDARAETRALCNGPEEASVFLFDIEGELAIDGVHIALPPLAPQRAEPSGGYREATPGYSGPAVAVVRICPGRHSIRTRVGTRVCAIDVFLHPREVWARRAPAGDGEWEDMTSGDAERARAGMREGRTVAIAYVDDVLSGIHVVVSVDVRVKRTITLYTKAVALIMAGAPADQVRRAKDEMCRDLDAAGLTAARIESLVAGFGNVIWAMRAEGALDKAIAATELALAVLPDEPRLLALLGETEMAVGKTDQGRVHLERALVRGKLLGPTSLDASWTARAEAALA